MKHTLVQSWWSISNFQFFLFFCFIPWHFCLKLCLHNEQTNTHSSFLTDIRIFLFSFLISCYHLVEWCVIINHQRAENNWWRSKRNPAQHLDSYILRLKYNCSLETSFHSPSRIFLSYANQKISLKKTLYNPESRPTKNSQLNPLKKSHIVSHNDQIDE